MEIPRFTAEELVNGDSSNFIIGAELTPCDDSKMRAWLKRTGWDLMSTPGFMERHIKDLMGIETVTPENQEEFNRRLAASKAKMDAYYENEKRLGKI